MLLLVKTTDNVVGSSGVTIVIKEARIFGGWCQNWDCETDEEIILLISAVPPFLPINQSDL